MKKLKITNSYFQANDTWGVSEKNVLYYQVVQRQSDDNPTSPCQSLCQDWNSVGTVSWTMPAVFTSERSGDPGKTARVSEKRR